MIRTFLLFLLTAISPLGDAAAQDSPAPIPVSTNSAQPIEITAQQSLEWHRNDLKFIARKDARATQGAVSISGQTLTADYKSTKASSIDIWRLTAEQDVHIKNEDSTAFGDHAVYDVEAATATLTGQDLKLITPDQTITATDRFVYKTNERRASAIGRAKVVRPTDTLEADRIDAVFKEQGGQGQNAIETLEATGNVVITTKEEVLTGAYALYRAATNTAEITGNVKITRGPNILEGARAEVDLTTNISRMFGSDNGGDRVRGVFYPKSAEKPDASTAEASGRAP